VLARLVAEVRAVEHARIDALLASALTAVQLEGFDRLLIVPEGARTSELDQLRGGTVSISGRGFQGALERAFAIEALGAGRVELPDLPPAKVAALARYGLSAKAPALRELSPKRRGDAAGDGPPAGDRLGRRRNGPVRSVDGDEAVGAGGAAERQGEAEVAARAAPGGHEGSPGARRAVGDA
jgi:hypothetical protein